MGSYADYKKRKGEIAQTAEVSSPQQKSSYQRYKERQRAANPGYSVDTEYQSLIEDYKTFAAAAQADSENVGYGNAKSYLTGRSDTAKRLRERANKLAIYLHSNQDIFDPEAYEAAVGSIEAIEKDVVRTMDFFGDRARYFSQWDTEDDYNTFATEQKAYENQLNLDTDAAAKEIAQLESYLKDYDNLTRWAQDEAGQQRENEYRSKYGSVQDLRGLINEKKAYLNTAKRMQEGIHLAGVADTTSSTYDPMFRLLSEYDPEISDNTYRYINNKLDAPAMNTPGSYQHMTDDEIALYNYYYSKEGAEAARKYLDSIQETLNYRSAQKRYGNLEGNTALELLFGIEAGLDRFGSGVKSLFSDGYSAPSDTQILSGMVREDLKDNGPKLPDWLGGGSLAQTGYDAITTTANVAPSILTSLAVGTVSKTAGAAMGNALMGASAAGSAYQEKLNMGYTKEQAGAYGLAIGASEIILEKALGGITAFGGGTISKVVAKNLNKVDNVLSRFAKSVGGKILMNAGSEALEEGLQTVLEPYLWRAVSGEEVGVEWEEALYSALLGAVSGGLFEGSGAMIGHVQGNSQTKQLYGASQQELVTEALEIDPENAFAKKMQAKLDAGKDLSGSELNKLMQQNEAASKGEGAPSGQTPPQQVPSSGDHGKQKGWNPFKKKYTTNEAENAVFAEAVDLWDQGKLTDVQWYTLNDTLKNSGAEAAAEQLRTMLAQAEHSPTFQEEVQRQFEEANGYGNAGQMDGPARTQENDAVLPDSVPLSIAEQMRQEQAQNGGTQYDNVKKTVTGPAAAQPAGGVYNPGRTGLSDGSEQWNAGTGTPEQTGSLAGSPSGRSGGRPSFAGRAGIDREARAKNLRLEKVSSKDLGLQDGTEARNIQIIPQEYWDAEMSQLADRIYNETGKGVTYVIGAIQVQGGPDGPKNVRGVYLGDRIIIQANHLKLSIDQIADHEAYHAKVDETSRTLNTEIRRHIIEIFSEEQYRAVLEVYVKQLRCVYNLTEAKTVEEYEETLNIIEEEVFADAYAGINFFGAGADQFTDAVNERMDQLSMGKIREQDNGSLEATGPPAERFSVDAISGEKTDYGVGVILDTDIFDGVRPRAWGEVLGKYVYNNLAGTQLAVYDEQGNQESIYIAKSNDRVRKDGAKNSHKVIDKLARYRSDNIKALATVHLSELLATSVHENATSEHSHQWLDENGWEYRKTYIQDRRGNIYEATLNIANGRDRRILYDINNVRLIDKKRAARGVVPSTNTGRGSLAKSNSPKNRITNSNEIVKERFSYAGENANNADLDALARAKEMRSAGVADETIRQQTGWHTGMDGKWRWEIDDSAMRYDSSGDLRGAESAKWAMEDYESARDDLWGHADMGTLEKVRAYNRADIAGDDATKQELYDELINGQYAYYFDQYAEAMTRAQGARNAPAGGTLQDYIDHPALFEAYPQLRNVTLRFERMGGGMMGYYNRTDNEIVLNTELRYAAEDTLVHEIQHAIQKAEGFTRGSNEEYWKHRQDGDDAVHVYDAKIQESEKKMDEIMRQLPENVAEQFRQWSAMDESSPEAMALMQELWGSPYNDLFEDYWFLNFGLDDMRRTNHKRGYRDLYRNTAGEIEARDVTARRSLTSDQRRSQEPARGDSYTVFMEDSDELSLQHGDRFSVEDDAYMEAVNNGDMKAAQRMVDAAAERWGAYLNNDEANEVFRQDSRVRTFYHGTNTGDFTRFDSRLLGSSSGDLGWFGKGFYFAFSYDEAATYGGRVIPAYLRMSNPYDYSRLYQFKGSDKGAAEYARFAWVYNITKQFPDIAEGQHVWAYPNDAEEGSAVSWKQLTTWMDQIQNKKQFSVEEVELNDGTTAWELRADPKKESFTTASGETFEWTEYGMTQIFATEQDAKEPINQIGAYLKNVMGVDSVPRRTIEKIDFSGALQRAGYDGILQSMSGDEAVVFSPEQIKTSEPVTYDDEGKVIPLSKRFSSRNPDIRYSVDDEGSQQAQEQKPAAPKKKIRPVAESRPLIAKKDLRNTVLNLFSIPNGQRAEVGSLIDSYADRLIKNGSLTEDDRKAFFDRMYDAGVMVMPAEEYSAFARSHIVDGRIYVSDSVKSDFGDDWTDIRRRAFAAGVYLVNDRSASGIDQWNATLSAEDMLPGLFDSEETDERTILERILQVAEEGKDEHLSLAEYTRRLSQQEGISEDEFLDNMERQLDWALRTFAEKARLEVHLRDRTGRKIAQEREKGTERMTRQQAKEAQRRADERQARKDLARRAKERRELRELQQRTLKQLQWLSKNRFRAPEELQATWDEVLSDIDIYAISAADEMRWSDKHNATWKDLVEMYDKAKAEDPNFFESKELERFVARLRYKKLEDLDIDALDALYKLATGLRTKFYNQKNVINDEMQRLFAEVYTDAKREIESAPGENSAQKGKVSGWADKFLNMDQLTPMNVLQRMGGWDPDGAFYSMAKQLERGERDMRAYSVRAQKMLQDFLTEHEDWVKKADGQGKDGLWYKIEIPELVALELGKTPKFGDTIEVWMTPMQKIHMYLESKNQDNLRHMTGGRTFAHKQLYSEGKRQEAFAQGKTVRMAPETVKAIVKDLTAEEMELAQILDRYYNTFATQEINKVSNILYGYDKAMGKNYAPIYTNRNYTKTEFGVFDTTAEGVGNLKGRQYAVNPSYNISAFDAFERHVDQTARFCGMAIPARNWTNLMNWREKNNSTGDVITHKWGEQGKKYIENLITTLQAGDDAKSESVSTLASRLQSNYISAVFGANPSIVLKQLGSIPLAGAYLDARNMPKPAQIARIDRNLISKYTQELEWRTMGYTTPETKQLKDNPNWTQSNKVFKFIFGGGAITAMDGWAASVLWPWAENKVRREYPELEMGSKTEIENGESAFYKKVAEEFENAMSRSQSVSDEIHQGTLRKSKNLATKTFTMFRSDSAQTYNALRQKIGEAQFYARIGAKDKVQAASKKAVGTVVCALLINTVWSEAVSFLMALWKNKGKYYRDDEDELTAESVIGEMGRNMMESIMGTVTFGDEIAQLIGNAITGDRRYDLEAPGLEQINEIFNLVQDLLQGNFGRISEATDVVKNGGNLGEYLSDNSGEIMGEIKETATKVATYFGLPVNNVEAYLLGALRWVSPELGTAYDDLFQSIGKSDLAGTEGPVLESRIGRILDDRKIGGSDETAQVLAALYAAGYKTAVPGDAPTSVSIEGEKHTLGAYQQQAYDTIWGGIVAGALDDMVTSDSFRGADPETQAKMLSNLYTYAAEQTKAELFDEYKLDSSAEKNAAIVAAGATVAECITWNTLTSKMKSGEKAAELGSWDIPEDAKREIFRSKISDSREDCITAFDGVGLSFDQFLQAYSMYSQINNEDLKASMKAVEFSHWINSQGYTADQAAVVKGSLTYFSMTPTSSSRYDKLVGAGMDAEDAYDLAGELNELQPIGELDQVSDVQRWRVCVNFSSNEAVQLSALAGTMDAKQYSKVEVAYDYSISPDVYVTLKETLPKFDLDGNGRLNQDEIGQAVSSIKGLTSTQRAVLWQISVSTKSAKNNPYSSTIGQQVLDALDKG